MCAARCGRILDSADDALVVAQHERALHKVSHCRQLLDAEHGLDEREDALGGGRARRQGEDDARRLGPRRELGVVRTPPRQQRLGVDVGVRAIEADVNEPSIGPERRKILESGRHAIFRRPPPKSHKKSRESHARPNFEKTFAKVWDWASVTERVAV